MTEIRKQALGRGLSALLGSSHYEDQEKDATPYSHLPMKSLVPGRNQPRHRFSEDELEALSVSIREKGVLQPILVRIHPEDQGKYEIVAGERRWRAAKRAGLEYIPSLIKEFSDAEALEVGLLENIQRQDLNPIEEAEGYRR
ncbi:MAG TPA: ParB/RepB/Spo0J family partition protein, partial [Alphaproteobacteria bacterium]|nr:ParB/RepB/Spo0J family partition protein [Alphaproteobacteria bacterium]